VPDFAHVITLRGPQGSSVTETYYRAGLSVNIEVGLWLPAGPLVAARLALMHSAWLLQKAVVHQLTTQHAVLQQNINKKGTAAVTGAPAGPSEAMVCQLVSAGLQKRKLWMRGISADTVSLNTNGIGVKVNPPIQTAFDDYMLQLRSGSFGIRYLNKLPIDGSGKWKITKADGTVLPGKTILTLDRAFGTTVPPLGPRVIIGSAPKKDLPGMNGHFQVLGSNSAGPPVTAANQLYIPYTVPQNGMVAGVLGSLRLESYAAIDIIQPPFCFIDYPGEHTTKSDFTGSRGASRAVRLRNSL
jgi:hypothetical protein